MVNRETGEYGSEHEAALAVAPTELVPAPRRQRRITDLEGPLHRRQIGTEGELDALDGTTGPLGQRGHIEALVDRAEVDNDSGVEMVLGRLLSWLAAESDVELEELRPRLIAQSATHTPAYRLEVLWMGPDGAGEGPSELVVPDEVPAQVVQGDTLPGSARGPVSEEAPGGPPTAPGLAPGEAAGAQAAGRDTHPDLPRVMAGEVQTGPAAMVAELADDEDASLTLDEQPGELLVEVPLQDAALDATILALDHERVRDALVFLSEQAQSASQDQERGDQRPGMLTVSQIPITRVDYDFDGRSFELWVAGFGEQIWAGEHPISAGLLQAPEVIEEALPKPPVALPIRNRPPSAPSVILNSGLKMAAESARQDRATARELPAVSDGRAWDRQPDTKVVGMPVAPPRRVARPPRSSAWIWWAIAAAVVICVCTIAGFAAWRIVSAQADARAGSMTVSVAEPAPAPVPVPVPEPEPEPAPEPAPEPIAEPAPDPRLDSLPEVLPEADGATHEVFGTAVDEEAPWLALRVRRNRHARLIAEMPDGTRLEQISRRKGWMKLRVVGGDLDGKTGWAHSKWLRSVR